MILCFHYPGKGFDDVIQIHVYMYILGQMLLLEQNLEKSSFVFRYIST